MLQEHGSVAPLRPVFGEIAGPPPRAAEAVTEEHDRATVGGGGGGGFARGDQDADRHRPPASLVDHVEVERLGRLAGGELERIVGGGDADEQQAGLQGRSERAGG